MWSWGRKLVNDALILWRNPVIIAPFHSVICIPKFVGHFFVGLNVCVNSPRRLVESINIIKDISLSDYVFPLCHCISNI